MLCKVVEKKILQPQTIDLVAEYEKRKNYSTNRAPSDDEKLYFPPDITSVSDAIEVLKTVLVTHHTEAIHGTSQKKRYGRLHLCQCKRGQARKEVSFSLFYLLHLHLMPLSLNTLSTSIYTVKRHWRKGCAMSTARKRQHLHISDSTSIRVHNRPDIYSYKRLLFHP